MKYFLIIVCFVILTPFYASATTSVPNFYVSGIPNDLGIGEEFKVDISVDTNNEIINGVDISVVVPEAFDVVRIDETDSVISLWIKQPKFEDDQIKLAGIIPGGFGRTIVPGENTDTKGKIASFILKPKTFGTFDIKLSDQVITLNDGEGTQIKNDDMSKQIVISNIQRETSFDSQDVTAPDLFYPKLLRDPSIFDGDLTLFFETRDFESGIARYEVREDDGPFVEATSPYRLRGQDQVAIITVRAIDRAGNDRTVQLLTGFHKNRVILWPVVLALVLGLFLLLLAHRKKQTL